MGNSVRLRALALVTAGILATWSLGGAAVADPKGDRTDQGRHLGQDKDKPDKRDKGDKGKGPQKDKEDRAQGGKPKDGDRPQGGPGKGAAFGEGDPAGNNGTVKIAGPGDEMGHPSNNAHPGCTFLVEWFGFDEGSDVVSTVTFASQAPTSDVVVGGTSPAQVFVGGDPASGGTDLDGRQAYALTFQGEPHPQQGYHVKVTVATPRSLGNDTKTKVFWVQPCAEATPDTSVSAGRGADETPAGASGDARSADAARDQGVLGETYAADQADQTDQTAVDAATVGAAASGSAPVPTAVDAGEEDPLPTWARSPLPLTLISFALVLAGAGIVLRNRARA